MESQEFFDIDKMHKNSVQTNETRLDSLSQTHEILMLYENFAWMLK